MNDAKKVDFLLDRFERETTSSIKRLKLHCRRIDELDRIQDQQSALKERKEARCLADQLLSSWRQLLRLRDQLNGDVKELFDARVEQMHVQATVDSVNILLNAEPSPPSSTNKSRQVGRNERRQNMFDECFEDDEWQAERSSSIYEEQLVSQSVICRTKEARLKMEQVREEAEATEHIARNIEDLNQVMVDLAQLIHNQHDMVESIEEHVERSAQAVQSGQQQLKKAVTTKNAKYPLLAATLGSVAIGGPVGLAASSTVLGAVAAIGGAVVGLYSGRALKKQVEKEATRTEN